MLSGMGLGLSSLWGLWSSKKELSEREIGPIMKEIESYYRQQASNHRISINILEPSKKYEFLHSQACSLLDVQKGNDSVRKVQLKRFIELEFEVLGNRTMDKLYEAYNAVEALSENSAALPVTNAFSQLYTKLKDTLISKILHPQLVVPVVTGLVGAVSLYSYSPTSNSKPAMPLAFGFLTGTLVGTYLYRNYINNGMIYRLLHKGLLADLIDFPVRIIRDYISRPQRVWRNRFLMSSLVLGGIIGIEIGTLFLGFMPTLSIAMLLSIVTVPVSLIYCASICAKYAFLFADDFTTNLYGTTDTDLFSLSSQLCELVGGEKKAANLLKLLYDESICVQGQRSIDLSGAITALKEGESSKIKLYLKKSIAQLKTTLSSLSEDYVNHFVQHKSRSCNALIFSRVVESGKMENTAEQALEVLNKQIQRSQALSHYLL